MFEIIGNYIRDNASALALIISVLALVVSIGVFWYSSLKKAKLNFMTGVMRTTVYPIKNGKKNWFLPHFFVPLTLVNSGAQAAKVYNLRVKVQFEGVGTNYDIFDWYGDLDEKQFDEDSHELFKWQKTSIINGNHPFFVLPKTTISKYLAFKTRWDMPILNYPMNIELQASLKENKWTTIDKWQITYNPPNWSEMTENGTTIGFSTIKNTDHTDGVFPSDLHTTLAYKEKIPKGGFNAGSSYLHRPKKKS